MSVDSVRAFLERLDEPHRRYAQQYADQLAVGDPAPSAVGLERDQVRRIRQVIWSEWRRRIDAMGGGRR